MWRISDRVSLVPRLSPRDEGKLGGAWERGYDRVLLREKCTYALLAKCKLRFGEIKRFGYK